MKNALYVFILSAFAITAFSQEQKFPSGVYLTLDQLRKKTPAFDVNLQVIRRTEGDIGFNGGNDYEIKSSIDSLNKKFIKKTMFAYVKNDSLFLNGFHHKLSTWYALCQTQGNFLAFKGCMSNDKNSAEVVPYGIMFGAIGGGIAGASAAKKRFLYVLSLRTGNVRPLKKEYISERLKENKDLLEAFNKEGEKVSDSVLVNYIALLNTITPIDSTKTILK